MAGAELLLELHYGKALCGWALSHSSLRRTNLCSSIPSSWWKVQSAWNAIYPIQVKLWFYSRVSQSHCYWHMGLDNSVSKGAVLCPVGCLAEFLATRCHRHLLPKVVPCAQTCLGDNHCSRVFFFKIEIPWKDKDQKIWKLVLIHVIMMIQCETKGQISQGLYSNHKSSKTDAFSLRTQYHNMKLHYEINNLASSVGLKTGRMTYTSFSLTQFL